MWSWMAFAGRIMACKPALFLTGQPTKLLVSQDKSAIVEAIMVMQTGSAQTATVEPEPGRSNERIEVLDMLRGFALKADSLTK